MVKCATWPDRRGSADARGLPVESDNGPAERLLLIQLPDPVGQVAGLCGAQHRLDQRVVLAADVSDREWSLWSAPGVIHGFGERLAVHDDVDLIGKASWVLRGQGRIFKHPIIKSRRPRGEGWHAPR